MKKLIITLEYPPQVGGIATYIEQFAKALVPEQTVVLAPKQKNGNEFDAGQKFKTIRKNLYWFLWPCWLKLFFIVRKIVKQEKIEIIYLHHILPVGYIGYLIKKFYQIPYLVFSHGTDVEYATRSPWKKNLAQKVMQGAEQIIFNSESLKRRLLARLPDFTNKCTVLYPCPESIFYEMPKAEVIADLKTQYALEGKRVMLSISRLGEGKGITHLVRILPRILQQIPNLVWLIVGDGPKRDYLIKEIQKNNLQNAVRFIGSIPHNELNKFYHLGELFVLLTHPDEGKEEGIGLVFLEAQAAGIPVIAGKSGGVEEGVINGETGIIVDIYQGDKIVADSICEMLKNKEFAKRLSINAQVRMKNDFNWENQLQVIKQWL